MGTKLYVGNLNYNTNEESLREAFGANGREVTSVSIIMDRETGRSRGFAFVEMATPEGAQQALQELDGQNLDGRMLRINEAREREARGPGGPGGPGGPRPFSGPRPGGPPRAGGRPNNFGPPAPPAGDRRRKEKEKDRDRGGDDDRGGKKGRKNRADGDDGW